MFLRARLVVQPALEEQAVAALWEIGCLGVHIVASGRVPRLTLHAYYPGRAGVKRLGGRLRKALLGAGLGETGRFRLSSVGPGRWVERWQRTLRPMQIGTFLVVPEGRSVSSRRGGRHTLRVRFGQAFGTGEHASTRLCLRLLERHLASGQSVADVGAGSGILAMAACRLGAGRVVAIDNDEVALSVARLNFRDNGLSERIETVRADAEEAAHRGPFDVLLVNIGAATIGRILPALAAVVAPGGRIILAGILVDDEADLLRAARRHRLLLLDKRRSRPWSALVLRRSGQRTS
jgi:ribosomal protein L11 methyltransferase